MIRVLLQKANDSNQAVAVNALMCLGELAAVGGEDVTAHIPELMQVIISIQTIAHLSLRVNFSDHASRIVHHLIRVLEGNSNELRQAVMDTLCALVVQLGSDFAIFVPTINKVRMHLFFLTGLLMAR